MQSAIPVHWARHAASSASPQLPRSACPRRSGGGRRSSARPARTVRRARPWCRSGWGAPACGDPSHTSGRNRSARAEVPYGIRHSGCHGVTCLSSKLASYRGSGWVGFRNTTGVALTERTPDTLPLARVATIGQEQEGKSTSPGSGLVVYRRCERLKTD